MKKIIYSTFIIFLAISCGKKNTLKDGGNPVYEEAVLQEITVEETKYELIDQKQIGLVQTDENQHPSYSHPVKVGDVLELSISGHWSKNLYSDNIKKIGIKYRGYRDGRNNQTMGGFCQAIVREVSLTSGGDIIFEDDFSKNRLFLRAGNYRYYPNESSPGDRELRFSNSQRNVVAHFIVTEEMLENLEGHLNFELIPDPNGVFIQKNFVAWKECKELNNPHFEIMDNYFSTIKEVKEVFNGINERYSIQLKQYRPVEENKK